MAPGAFTVHAVCVPPGATRAYRKEDWRDSLVLVVAGDIDLVGLSGTTHTCRAGDLIWLDGLPLRLLRNSGSAAVLLVAFAR